MGLHTRAWIVAAVAALVVMPVAPAEAAPTSMSGTLMGSGTISPGLVPLSGNPQSMTLSGTATLALADATVGGDVASANCSFSGGSSGLFANETSALGTGTLVGGCAGAGVVTGMPFSASCSLQYVRELFKLLNGTCSVTANGSTTVVTFTGFCSFLPTTLTPTTSYDLSCGFAAA